MLKTDWGRRAASWHPLAGRLMLIPVCIGLLSCSSFEQTSDRGSLMQFETVAIPRDFIGLWALSRRSCDVNKSTSAQLKITSNLIDDARVENVWGYSDYADIVVETGSPRTEAKRGDTIFLQLSINGQKLRFSKSGDRRTWIFHRCVSK